MLRSDLSRAVSTAIYAQTTAIAGVLCLALMVILVQIVLACRRHNQDRRLRFVENELNEHRQKVDLALKQIAETFEAMRSTHKLHLTNDALRQHLEGVSAIQTEIVRRFEQLPEEKKASWRESLSAEERELLEDLLAEEHERTDPAFQFSAQKAEANRG